MAEKRVVKQGECVSSLAFEHGFHPETVWSAPDNEALRTLRGDPNVLLPGDVVTIPDLRPKSTPRPRANGTDFAGAACPRS